MFELDESKSFFNRDEQRLLMIGRVDGRHWSAVVTRRGDKIRLISVRRSRLEEINLYESEEI